MELKKFTSKSLAVNTVVVDGQTPFQYAGKLAVCTKATYEDGIVTAYVTLYDLTTKVEADPTAVLKLFEINSAKNELEDLVLTLNDCSMLEEAPAAKEPAEDAEVPPTVINTPVVDRYHTDIRN